VAREQVAQGLRDSGFVDRLLTFLAGEEGGLLDVAQRVEELLSQPEALATETLAAPLPRLHLPQHLYAPLLLAQAPRPAATTGPLSTGDQLPLFGGGELVPMPMRCSPPALNSGEAKFLWDLRAYWQGAHDSEPWREVELFVLRNPASGGLLLYRGSGFAPDFMVWLKRGGRQALALVDPKGLALQWPQDKLDLIDELESRELSLPVRGFLVSVTAPERMRLPPGLAPDAESLRKQRVLLQSSADYIEHLLCTLAHALAPAGPTTTPALEAP
jgi:hypothetical protein